MSCQEEVALPAAPAPAQPHVLLVSCPLQGHVNPLLRLGSRLAAKGLLVTFTTFRHAGLRGMHADGVRFEHLLRDTTADDAADRRLTPGDMLRLVLDAGPAAMADLLRRQADAGRPVTCVVNTTFVPWALQVARELGVPCRATLWTQSCAVLSLYHHFYNSSSEDAATFPQAPDDAPVVLPGLPAMSMDELPLMVRPEFAHNLWGEMLRAQLLDIHDKKVPWVLVNSFHALERAAIDALPIAGVVPVGPLLDDDEAVMGDDDNGVMAWLDAQPPRSVVYVAFGSLVDIGPDETAAVAEGLVGTGRPFLWVVRDDNLVHLPAEFIHVASDTHNGKIVAWCQQRRVLSHGAVGCFVTHCGWNSVVEALAAGVPLVGYPWWSDQFTNAKFLVEEYGVGVRLPAPVTPDALRVCIEKVVAGPEAAAIRTRVTTWKEEADAAMARGGSSHRSLHDFVDILRNTTRII